MNKVFEVGLAAAVVVVIGLFLYLMLTKPNHDAPKPPDENDYQRMVHRAGELAIRFGDGKLGLEEHCEYQELCSRIGKYRADHETR